MLWGLHAQEKIGFLGDGGGRHLILRSRHPSPMAARKGFFGSRHFSQANSFLAEHGRGSIDWSLPSLQPQPA
jgi:uracil-DNA glycosylase